MKKIIFLSLILLVLAASGCLDRAATPAATSVPPVNVTGTPSPVSPGPTVETKPPATPAQPAPTTTAGPSPRTPAATRTPRPTPGKADIQVQNMDTETDFPQTITFSLKARSPVNITRIAIRYSTGRITVAPVISEAVVNFQPAGTADVRWVWDMRKGGIPVGAKIKYQWVLTDDKGGRLTTEMNELTYIDPRFTGKSSLSWGDVNIYWYDGSLRFGQTLMDAAQGALEKLTQNTGATLERPANIYIYSGTQDLQSSLVFPQEWTGGVAFTDYSIVVIGISPDNQSLAWGKRTVAHELAHLVTHQVTFNPYGVQLPTWLNEGLSQYAEGDIEQSTIDRLKKASRDGKLFSVRSLSGSFSANSDEALLSYAESESLVRYLIEKFGRDKMQQYLGLFKDGVEAEEGLMKVYGYNYDSLNTVWQSNLKTGFQVNNHYFLPVLSGIFLPVRLNMGKAW